MLLLRHYEAWKASVERGRAVAAAAGAAVALGRRAQMRRALLGMASGAEAMAGEREAARPRLRQVFGAWERRVTDVVEKEVCRGEEERDRGRYGFKHLKGLLGKG